MVIGVLMQIGSRWGKQELINLWEEATKTTHQWFGVAAAQAHGAAFVWPRDVTVRDSLRLAAARGSLECAVAAVHLSRVAVRLSEARVRTCVMADDPDLERLVELARDGLRVDVHADFMPTSVPPPFRSLYKRLEGAVNEANLKLWEKGLVFLLMTEQAKTIEGIHYSPAHWAVKHGSPAGRAISDNSDDSGGHALKTPEAAASIEAHYGKIEHPTIGVLVRMVNKAIARFGVKHVMLWKGDLRGAFSLLNFAARDTPKLACALTGGITMIYTTGYFGWTGTPFGFDVISRVLRRGIRTRIRGEVDVYVDDFMGASHVDDAASDLSTAERYAEELLGPDAIAKDKRALGRRLDFIGYTVDLDQKLVTIKRANFLKTLYGFMTTDILKKQSVAHLQRLASWASRYSGILRHMRPFSAGLYGEVTGMRNQGALKTLGWPAKRAIIMWTAMLVLLDFDEATFARSFRSFEQREPDTVIRFDASLYGIGVSVSVLVDGVEKTVGVVGTVSLPFQLSDSSYQNTMEFIAVVVGCFLLARKGYRNRRVALVGDSITALHWAEKESFTGGLVFAPALLYVLLGGALDLWVCATTHIAGTENGVHDGLSRGQTPAHLGFDPSVVVAATEGSSCWAILEMCDPSIPVETVEGLSAFWRKAVSLVRELTTSKC